MAGSVRSLGPDVPVIEVVVEGSMTDPDSMDLVTRGMRLQHEEGYLLGLVDASLLTQKAVPALVIQVADHLRDIGVPAGWKQAVLRPRDLDAAMAVDLWEAAANNRGLTVKVFRDREQALSWLLAD